MKLVTDESGSSAAEYALLLGMLGACILGAALALGGAVGNSLTSSADAFAAAGAASPFEEAAANVTSPAPAGDAGSTAGSTSPGHSGEAPGHTGAAPGLGGDGPVGQTGQNHGQSKK